MRFHEQREVHLACALWRKPPIHAINDLAHLKIDASRYARAVVMDVLVGWQRSDGLVALPHVDDYDFTWHWWKALSGLPHPQLDDTDEEAAALIRAVYGSP